MSEQAPVPDAVPEVRLDARIRRVGDALIVASPTQDALELTDAAVLAFRQINGAQTIGEISAAVADCYGVEWSLVQADILDVMVALMDAGVVTLRATKGGTSSKGA